jgi:hypothetical protein
MQYRWRKSQLLPLSTFRAARPQEDQHEDRKPSVTRSQRLNLRCFLEPSLAADVPIRKSGSFPPSFNLATNQRGFAPRPAQVSPVAGSRYLAATLRPFSALTAPLRPLPTPSAPSLASWLFSSSAFWLRTAPISSRSLSNAGTSNLARFIFAIIISNRGNMLTGCPCRC